MTDDFRRTTADDLAAFCVETTFRDSLSGITRVYYPSGFLRQYVPFADVNRQLVHGTLSTWYEDGQMRSKQEFLGGVRNGDLRTYYPDGTLMRSEQYEQGRCGVGKCYAPNGEPVPYFAYEQLPLYPGGEAQLLKELEHAVRLNAQELAAMYRESGRMQNLPHNGWKRQVDVELTVAPDGHVINARVANSTAYFLNNAALRAVGRLKRQFVPGRRDGQVTLSYLTVPVFYTISSAYKGGAYQADMYPRRMGRF
ncbi:MAG: TonB family protein [Bacteroidota bacterium]|nr:TonB family protein [Bacteroidota bacterium]